MDRRTSFFVVLLLLSLPLMVFAQPDFVWRETLATGSQTSYDMIRTSDGNYAQVVREGYTADLLYLIAPNGDEIWHKTYGETGNYDGHGGVLEMPDGGFLLAGYEWVDAQAAYDARLIRIDVHGVVVWQALVGDETYSDFARKVVRTDDGRIFMAGESWSGSNTEGTVWEFNDAGTLLNTWYFNPVGASGGMTFSSILISSDNHLVMNGGGYFNTDDWDGWAVKCDMDGDVIWNNVLEHTDWQHMTDLYEMPDGTFYFAGNSQTDDGEHVHPWHGKLAANGSAIFTHDYGTGDPYSNFKAVKPDLDGNILLVGTFEAEGTSHGDAFMLKVDPSDGSMIWTLFVGESNAGSDERFSDVVVLDDGSYMLSGDGDFGDTSYPSFITRYGEPELAMLDLEVQGGLFAQYIDPEGGDLTIDVTITNTLAAPFGAQAWAEVIGPSGTHTLVQIVNIMLNPGSDIFVNDLIQTIPGWAPPGRYLYRANLGLRPFVYTSDSFWFVKEEPVGVAGNSAYDDWELIGWDRLADTSEAEAIVAELPKSFNLLQAYPNPFNAMTTAAVTLPEASELTVDVVNVRGQRVATLYAGHASAGQHQLSWSADHLASGVYFIRAEIPGQTVQMQKVLLMK